MPEKEFPASREKGKVKNMDVSRETSIEKKGKAQGKKVLQTGVFALGIRMVSRRSSPSSARWHWASTPAERITVRL